MKVLSLILKIAAILSFCLALIVFGSDLLPVNGISFDGHGSAEDGQRFYKILPVEDVNVMLMGLVFANAGIIFYLLSVLINNYLVRQRGT